MRPRSRQSPNPGSSAAHATKSAPRTDHRSADRKYKAPEPSPRVAQASGSMPRTRHHMNGSASTSSVGKSSSGHGKDAAREAGEWCGGRFIAPGPASERMAR